MEVSADLDYTQAKKAMTVWRATKRATIEETVRAFAKMGMRRVIEFTPPQSTKNKGLAAKKALETRILGDLHNIMVPVRLKKKLPERHPSLEALLSESPIRLRRGVATRYPRHPAAYVDVVKFKRLYKKQAARVGSTMSGWGQAAAVLKLGMPAWGKRHGTNGRYIETGSGDLINIEAANPRFKGPDRHYDALIQFGLDAAARGMQQQAERIIERRLARAGLSA